MDRAGGGGVSQGGQGRAGTPQPQSAVRGPSGCEGPGAGPSGGYGQLGTRCVAGAPRCQQGLVCTAVGFKQGVCTCVPRRGLDPWGRAQGAGAVEVSPGGGEGGRKGPGSPGAQGGGPCGWTDGQWEGDEREQPPGAGGTKQNFMPAAPHPPARGSLPWGALEGTCTPSHAVRVLSPEPGGPVRVLPAEGRGGMCDAGGGGAGCTGTVPGEPVTAGTWSPHLTSGRVRSACRLQGC